ncbi:Uu.00g052650.m01.CDS01 [Anthostomella pinea]|uniref:Uu.00g052650.m01.CDS01 n=1 Tax=Anthostomella pinea TaxID=933095 RepID=A0AAI8VWW6_9PEZI|nr:Uu.00g052650.m01.CDS01 [Anthostomella pinea]
MSGSKPVFVFCPGAWLLPDYFQPTINILKTSGYTSEAVALPSVDSDQRPADAPPISHGLQTDASAVRAAVVRQLDAGHDVVLVAHSYGGLVISEAARGLDRVSRGHGVTSIIHMVYVAALVFDVGAKVWPDDKPPVPKEYIIDGELVYRNPADPDNAAFLSQCSPEQLAAVVAVARSHNWRTFTDPVTYAAWKVVDSTYVKARHDPVPDPVAELPEGHRFVEQVEIGGDHFVFTSATEEVAAVLRGVAENVGRGGA